MREVMGPLPREEKRCPLDVKTEEEADCGDYVRRYLTYASEPGSRVPAYLLIPNSALNKKLSSASATVRMTNTPSNWPDAATFAWLRPIRCWPTTIPTSRRSGIRAAR